MPGHKQEEKKKATYESQENSCIACLHDQSKSDFFGEPAFFQPIIFLKTFQIALIGWIKAGLPKRPLLF